MLSVSFDKTDNECSFVIGGKEYIDENGEKAIIPKTILEKINVEDIPEGFEIEVCDYEDSSLILISIPVTFVKNGKNEFEIHYNEQNSRKDWDGPIELKLYMETKKKIIKERSKEMIFG